ncbi:MAG: hypothetical protein II882_04030 [Lachnospiraceae bacterium]|nr:hypothetical protein [Lachnospiraceae bacterium]
MKMITADPARFAKSGVFFESGDFRFSVDADWIKWPEDAKGYDCLCADFVGEDLYVTTSSLDYPICVFDRDGNFVRTFGQGLFDRPHSLGRTKEGTFLVADSGNKLHTIQEIDGQGNLIRVFGTTGVPSDTGYDVDAYTKLVAAGKISEEEQKRNLINNTSFYYEQDSIVRLAGPFNRPCCMQQASTGEFFAADGYGNCGVHKFDKDGNYVKSWGGPGRTDPEDFYLPHWVNIDKYDRVWVSDRENHRVHVYDTEGRQLALISGYIRQASTCSDDRYVYLGQLSGELAILDIDTLEEVAHFGFPGLNMFAFHSICLSPEGDIVLSSIRGLRKVGNILRFRRY